MKLTEKDRDFLEKLRDLLDEKQLAIELRQAGVKRMILKKNYGDRIENAYGVTRQGVRWRFQRIFNEIYTSAYETIFMVESSFGTRLRHMALEIVRERVALRKKLQKMGKITPSRR